MELEIIKGKKWGYDWGLGSAVINILWFTYLYTDTQSMFFIFVIILELIVAIMLISNKVYFDADPTIAQSVRIETLKPNAVKESSNKGQTNNEYQQDIVHLNTLIHSGKTGLFGSKNKNEIKELIEKLCATKEDAEHLLKAYAQLFMADLIEDLKQLTKIVTMG